MAGCWEGGAHVAGPLGRGAIKTLFIHTVGGACECCVWQCSRVSLPDDGWGGGTMLSGPILGPGGAERDGRGGRRRRRAKLPVIKSHCLCHQFMTMCLANEVGACTHCGSCCSWNYSRWRLPWTFVGLQTCARNALSSGLIVTLCIIHACSCDEEIYQLLAGERWHTFLAW